MFKENVLRLDLIFIRPISEDELKNLQEHRYAAISDKQVLIDQKLQAEVSFRQSRIIGSHHFLFRLAFKLLHCFLFCVVILSCFFLFCLCLFWFLLFLLS